MAQCFINIASQPREAIFVSPRRYICDAMKLYSSGFAQSFDNESHLCRCKSSVAFYEPDGMQLVEQVWMHGYPKHQFASCCPY